MQLRLANLGSTRTRRSSLGIDWDVVPLGEKSDRAIATALGVSPQTVLGVRRRRGISPFVTAKGGRNNAAAPDERPAAARRKGRKKTLSRSRRATRLRVEKHGTAGRVYFIQSGDAVKIGWTRDSAAARLAALQPANPTPLALLGVIPEAGVMVERDLHRRFASLRLGPHEWFLFGEELRRYVETNTQPES